MKYFAHDTDNSLSPVHMVLLEVWAEKLFCGNSVTVKMRLSFLLVNTVTWSVYVYNGSLCAFCCQVLEYISWGKVTKLSQLHW